MAKKTKETFNPIKEDKDGVIAKRMIWSTKSLELALKGLNEGKKLIANPFYENNTKLLKGDLVFERTEDEIAEWKKCKNDLMYFVETYCKIMTPEGIQSVHLRDYQIEYLKHLEKNRLSVFLSCRQSGKCLVFNELVKIRGVFDEKLKKYFDKHYYNNHDNCYDVPLFELYNLYENSFIWKIKYQLYKLIYKMDKHRNMIIKNYNLS